MGTISRTINAAAQDMARKLDAEITADAWRRGRTFRVGDHVWLPPHTDKFGKVNEARQAVVKAIHPPNDEGVRRYTCERLAKDSTKRWVAIWDESALTLVEVAWK